MPLPRLSAAQIEGLVQEVTTYIGRQQQTYRAASEPLNSGQKNVLRPFFPEPTLDLTRLVVLTGQRVHNPPFYDDLRKMGFEEAALPDFSLMAAVTFVDTVVSHQPLEARLLFHELVHVVQYARLGVAEFAMKYVNGFLSGGSYESIPLEMNAYELDGRFAAAPTNAFSVASEVGAWIAGGRF
jgi:hypothetical protein